MLFDWWSLYNEAKIYYKVAAATTLDAFVQVSRPLVLVSALHLKLHQP